MKSTIDRAKFQKGFYLGDHGTHSKSVSGGKKPYLSSNAYLYLFLNFIFERTQKQEKKQREKYRKLKKYTVGVPVTF